jgi:hypothetical protein
MAKYVFTPDQSSPNLGNVGSIYDSAQLAANPIYDTVDINYPRPTGLSIGNITNGLETSTNIGVITDGLPFNKVGWVRIQVFISQGIDIISAILALRSIEIAKNNPTAACRVYMIEADDAPTIASRNAFNILKNSSDAVLLTTIQYGDHPDPSPGFSGQISTGLDRTAVIQSIIDRPGWSNGNSILFLFEVIDNDPFSDYITWRIDGNIDSGANAGGNFTAPSVSGPIRLVVEYGHEGLAYGAGAALATSTFLIKVNGVGSSSGNSVVSGVSQVFIAASSAGSSTGTSIASGVSQVFIAASSAGSSSGSSTVSGISQVLADVSGDGSSTANSAATGTSASLSASEMLSEGVSNAEAAGSAGTPIVGSSNGSSDAPAVGAKLAGSLGETTGTSATEAISSVLAMSPATSEGTSEVNGSTNAVATAVGSSANISFATGRSLSETQKFLMDLARRRGVSGVGHDSTRFLELNGAVIIEPTAFEPDPATHRHSYYYNAVSNTLYRKVITREELGLVVAYWQKASQD